MCDLEKMGEQNKCGTSINNLANSSMRKWKPKISTGGDFIQKKPLYFWFDLKPYHFIFRQSTVAPPSPSLPPAPAPQAESSPPRLPSGLPLPPFRGYAGTFREADPTPPPKGSFPATSWVPANRHFPARIPPHHTIKCF